jgi:hypothetical protein
MRTLADIATALRLGIAAYIIYAGLQHGRESFGSVAAATLIGWTLDTVDGHLARAASNPEPTWLGRNDRYIDSIMVLAGFVYLTLVGIVPVWVCVAYLLGSALVLIRFRSIAVLTVLEAPLALLIPVTALFLAPLWFWLFVAWGLVALILDRRRLWVRLGIIWEDAKRLKHSPGHDNSSLSTSGQNGERPQKAA